MDGYMGEYGEVFLGIGYSHPSATDRIDAAGTETHPSTASWDNSSNSAQPFFVAAQIYEGRNALLEPHLPGEQHQQQKLEKDVELARSKAQDILRNILHGLDSNEADGNSQVSLHLDQANGQDVSFGGINSTGNQNNNYYGPREGFTSTTHTPSNTTEIAQIPKPSASSIKNSAEAARMKALGILRKFQFQPNRNYNANSVCDTDDRGGATQSMLQSSSVSNYGPQKINEATTDTYGLHRIPQHVPSQSKPQSPITAPVIPDTIPATVALVTTPPCEFARLRRESLAKDEERKQRALFKNLQYVARLEEERLAKQLAEVQQVKTLEQQIDERYQQKMEYRMKKRNNINNGSNNINTSGAGIGTKQRRKAEAKRQKTALPPSLRQKHQRNRGGNNGSGKNGSDSVAIYISNLPTDDSIDEIMVQGLFSAYGSLRKVHFYVDKVTGRKKGDALVIYSLAKGEDQMSFTESVCSQVGTYLDRVVSQ